MCLRLELETILQYLKMNLPKTKLLVNICKMKVIFHEEYTTGPIIFNFGLRFVRQRGHCFINDRRKNSHDLLVDTYNTVFSHNKPDIYTKLF